ncbi:3-deoxy-D-manno-octulosonic acid transferase [Achlya hypogyna]|uniref:3-deoxy-D-manno-octulosonic acid transferase n=1 Tax=Achlya hypogyna TaxID=1202772 RepID=A0A1V9ZHX4_ACHHY|nr:3-deoxy-D-manno-octulosonic acid transferase [Achlya hypogyna]
MLPETVELRAFQFYGFECRGIFAVEDLPENAVVWTWDTATEPLETFTRAAIVSHPEREKLANFSYMVGDDAFASTLEPERDPCWYFNHACDPNCWFEGDGQLVTRRAVKKGEQLCYDYACTETESSLHAGMICQCGSEKCRGKLTFGEWRSRAFIKANYGHVTDFIMKKHAENSWYDSRMELRHKSATSLGLFCREDSDCKIQAGETVLVFSGKVVHKDQFLESGAMTARDFEMSLQVHKDLWQIPAWKETGDKIETSDYINHSCDPTCGMHDSVTVKAIRDIYPGEEITIDYCMVNDGVNDEPSDNFVCNCGSSNCRREITTLDWQLPELQSRLGPYFAPFVKRLIESPPFEITEIKVYRMLWHVCRPFITWFVGAKDLRRSVPAVATKERFGQAKPPDTFLPGEKAARGLVWIHGASVGECLSALPLIHVLTQCPDGAPFPFPRQRVLLTTTTPSARALLQERLRTNPHATCVFAPLDHVPYVQTFLSIWKPTAALWIESELWPNMIIEAAKRQMPMGLVNGRMSARSFRRWNSWLMRRLARHLLAPFSALTLCQSPEDLHRFQLLGVTGAKYVGDIKFLSPKPPVDPIALEQLRCAMGGRPAWVAVSTHEGEENACVQAHAHVLAVHPDALLILIPRHPHRCAAVLSSIAFSLPLAGAVLTVWQMQPQQRTIDAVPSRASAVFVVDVMGETQLYFEAAPVVFVGGSLVDVGGHNVLEPLRSGCTVLHGPHMRNCSSVLATLAATAAPICEVSASTLGGAVIAQLSAPREASATDATAPLQAALWTELGPFFQAIDASAKAPQDF